MFSKIQTRLAKNRVILTIYHVHHMSTTNPESRNFIEVWWLNLHFYVNINKQSHCHKKIKIYRFKIYRFRIWLLTCEKQDNKFLWQKTVHIYKHVLCHNFSLPRFARFVPYLSFLHAKEDQWGEACLEPERNPRLGF